jgi:hypothetical protein
VLTSKGVTAWRRALATAAPGIPPAAVPLPTAALPPMAAELTGILAGLALGGP